MEYRAYRNYGHGSATKRTSPRASKRGARNGRQDKPAALVLALVAGFGVGFTPAFSIVHELGHVIAGWLSPGVQVMAVRWTVTYWTGSATPVFFAAGHYTMMLADAAAAVHARRRGALGVGFFALGHALCQPVYAAFSQDFAQLSSEFGFDTAVFFWVVLAGTTLSFALLQAARLLEKREALLRRRGRPVQGRSIAAARAAPGRYARPRPQAGVSA
jgi:hypothetical protein